MELSEVSEPKVLAEGLAFPEGPVALGDGSVLVVEIRAGRLTRVGPDGTVSLVADVGGGPNGAAIGPDGAVYVCNNSGMSGYTTGAAGIQRVSLESGAVDVLYTSCDGVPLARPNDLVFDRTGNFWFTDLGGGAVYYASPDGTSITRAWTGLSSPNGVGLSPDETVLYTAQTRTRQVLRRRLLGPGAMEPSPNHDVAALIRGGAANPDVLVVGLPGAQELDSLAVEANGFVCVATLMDSGITVVSPQGEVVEKHTLPAALADPVVTNICFGGPDRRTAFITLSYTGRLISCRWPRPGLELNFQQ